MHFSTAFSAASSFIVASFCKTHMNLLSEYYVRYIENLTVIFLIAKMSLKWPGPVMSRVVTRTQSSIGGHKYSCKQRPRKSQYPATGQTSNR